MTQTFADHRAARNYAAALLAEARLFSAVAVTGDFLTALADMIRDDGNQVHTLTLCYKKVNGNSQISTFFASQGCTQPDFILRFLVLLAAHNRFSLVPTIAQLYKHLYDQEMGIMEVSVISAAPMTDQDQQAIVGILKKQWGQPRVMFSVNPLLLAGFQILVGSSLYDLSLAARLRQFKTKLSGVIARSYEGEVPQ
jgi:F-type H+-transporting ATPase subunit delta